jgi:Xaa-Pro aminopeptidase
MNVQLFAGLKKKGKARLQATTGVVANMRRVKDDSELAAIRKAVDIAQRGFEKLTGWLKPGMREREVAARLTYDMTRMGAQGPAFAPIVAVGRNGSLPHYEPGDGVVSDREGVLIDWGARADWYVSDLTRVVWPGSIPTELAKVYQVVREAQQAAIAAIKPGVSASSVDRIARSHIAKAGYGRRFTHSLGHGIGLNVHEGPGLRKGGEDKLEPGMVVTVEPGVYLPGVGGVRIEDDVLVTAGGHEVLSSLPSDLDAMKLGR